MKTKFFEYYPLSKDRIKEIWEKGIIVFDTSALLNFFRYPIKAGNHLIKALSECQDRLWIPYQVGWEYHKNLDNTILTVESSFDNFEKRLNDAKSSFYKTLNIDGFRNPVTDFKKIKEQINQSLDKILKEVKGSKDLEFNKQDLQKFKDKIAILFEDKIGNDYTDSQLEDIYKEGKSRYDQLIPPGFCDKKNKKDKPDREKFGDVIVWKQTIHKSKTHSSDVIFVTGEKKDDWFEQNKEGSKVPRKELIKEFRRETGNDILIYEFADFLNAINDHLSLGIEIETLEEVTEISKEREIRYSYLGQYIDINRPYDSNSFYTSPLERYLSANPSHPNIEIIKYLKRLHPLELLSQRSTPLDTYLRANASNPDIEIIKYLERLSPYELPGMQNTPLDTYLRANTAHPDIEVIKYLERLSPYELPGMQNTPLDTYLRANTAHPDIEVIKYLEKLSPYELPGMQNTPLDTYLRANAAHPDIEVIQSLDRTK